MVERRTPNPDVGGSSPSWPAIFVCVAGNVLRLLGSLSRVSDVTAGGRVAMAASTKPKKNSAVKSDKPSPFSPAEIKKFIEEVKVEFLKIVWPDKKTTLGLTGVVVVMTIILSIYLGSVDLLLGKVVSSFLR